jgi:hypothetical protein
MTADLSRLKPEEAEYVDRPKETINGYPVKTVRDDKGRFIKGYRPEGAILPGTFLRSGMRVREVPEKYRVEVAEEARKEDLLEYIETCYGIARDMFERLVNCGTVMASRDIAAYARLIGDITDLRMRAENGVFRVEEYRHLKPEQVVFVKRELAAVLSGVLTQLVFVSEMTRGLDITTEAEKGRKLRRVATWAGADGYLVLLRAAVTAVGRWGAVLASEGRKRKAVGDEYTVVLGKLVGGSK